MIDSNYTWWTEYQLAAGKKEQRTFSIDGETTLIQLEYEQADLHGPTYLVSVTRNGRVVTIDRCLTVEAAREQYRALVNRHDPTRTTGRAQSTWRSQPRSTTST